MPKPSLHALTWSQEHQHYELHMHGQLHQCFPRGDEPAWLTWLAEHTAFAFVGQHGRISVIKEARERGTGYWYAYRRQDRHTSKRYLGPTAQVTFARLEEVAQVLTRSPSPADSKLGLGGPGQTLRVWMGRGWRCSLPGSLLHVCRSRSWSASACSGNWMRCARTL